MRRDLPSVALLIDYDNLEIGASYDLPGRPLDLGCLIELAQKYGTVVVARAYADWGDSNERLAVYESGIEPCFAPIFRTTADQPGKSLADTVLVADGVDILWRIAPEFLVLVTSDKDILPLARLARLRGTRTVVVGSDRTAIPLRRLADEYVTYRDLLAGTGVPVATHQRAGLVPLSRGQSELRGPRLLAEPRPPAASRPEPRRPAEPRRAAAPPPPSTPVLPPPVEVLPASGSLAGRPAAEVIAPADDAAALAATEAANGTRRRRRRRGGGGRGAGAGEPGIVGAAGAMEMDAALSETSEPEITATATRSLAARRELASAATSSLLESGVLAEAAGAGARVLADASPLAKARTSAPDAEALEEEIAPTPAPPPPPPPAPVSPVGRLGFAAFGSFEDTPRAVEPEPITPADADRAVTEGGPAEAPPEAALESAATAVAPEAVDAPVAEPTAEDAAAEAPARAPARRRSTGGRGRRPRGEGEADPDPVTTTEGTPS